MPGPGASIAVVQATPFDAALLAALHRACFSHDGPQEKRTPWGEEAMAQFTAGPGTLCLLAKTHAPEAEPAGFLIARAAAGEAELLTIGVLSDYRRRGVGEALLGQAIAALRDSGIGELFLEVDETNEAARALYARFGAETVGRRANYYEGGGDAAVLRLTL